MMESFDTSAFLVLMTTVLTAFFGLYKVFDKKMKDRSKEADELESRIKKLYREESDAQQSKISELEHTVSDLKEKVDKMSAENTLMKDLLQGRDTKTKEYQERGLKTMHVIEEMAKISTLNGKKLDAVMVSIEKLYKVIEKHLSVEVNTNKQGGE